jgi:hypothetical protein
MCTEKKSGLLWNDHRPTWSVRGPMCTEPSTLVSIKRKTRIFLVRAQETATTVAGAVVVLNRLEEIAKHVRRSSRNVLGVVLLTYLAGREDDCDAQPTLSTRSSTNAASW